MTDQSAGGGEVLPQPERDAIRIEAVLAAMANPLRLRVLQALADHDELTCGTALPDVPASTASRHWQVLRESGLLQARRVGRTIQMSLRREDLDARFPGLLDDVLRASRDSELVARHRVVPATSGGGNRERHCERDQSGDGSMARGRC
jgi:DNA-binding transcriptional ArsR family regulator